MHGAAAAGGGVFMVNTLAPFVLTALLGSSARRYVFVSSAMHMGGDASLRDLKGCGYSDSKLHDLLMAKYFGRKFAAAGEGKEAVVCDSLDPGWVPTRMGGAGAPDNMEAAVETYVMLAEGSGAVAERDRRNKGFAGHWYQGKERRYMKAVDDEAVQEKLIKELERISGVKAPA
ncbi:hypothetical protein F5Y19DRAFT_413258 [Xylariaceae sp. FL1651]|nr:hypothetical protein F5Y19DRAFT_413258 [Xylariaceae sp. FL1651]